MSTRVLIIDPNIPFMVGTKQALEGTGDFEVSVSANGLAAQDSLRQMPHDIAVIDFNVADMDVLELLAQLRRLQPDLRFLLSYTSDEQAGRAPYLGVHGTIAKPYNTRELIVQLYRALARRAPGAAEERAEPPAAESSDAPEDTPPVDSVPFIEGFDDEDFDDEAPFEAARFAESQAQATEPTDADLRRIAQTRRLHDEPSPADTNTLHDWQDIDRTGSLRKTDALEDPDARRSLNEDDAEAHFVEEAPVEGDTPTVPQHDLDGVRQFLATDLPEHDPTTFGEVLDALAQAPLPDTAPSPDDQAFHELVDSLRAPAAPARRGTLEDYLTSTESGDMPPDEFDSAGGSATSGVNALDYVLDSIRRGQPAGEPDPSDEAALDDTTIGDVIGGLFGPSFQSVLDAMAGDDVEDAEEAEPSYSGRQPPLARVSPNEDDRIGPDDFGDAETMPDWLARLDMPDSGTTAGRPSAEPPVNEDDSSHYPATAALNAVSDEEQEAGFSLNDLLSQIEQQLPPPRVQRPRLRPLPSWEQNASPEEAEQLRQVFPADEGWEPADIEEIFSVPPDRPPQNWDDREDEQVEEPLDDRFEAQAEQIAESASFDDTAAGSSELPPAQDERLGAGWDAFADEGVAGEALPADFEQLLEPADEAEPVERDEPDRMALELDLDVDLMETVQRASTDEPLPEPPAVEVEEDTLATEISEAFYEGVRQTAYDWEEADDDAFSSPTAPEWQPAAEAEIEEDPAYTGPWREPSPLSQDVESLDDVPTAPPARLMNAEPELEPEAPPMDDDEAAKLAQIALQLTQFSLESSAQATVLAYHGELIAQAGSLPTPAIDRLERAIETAWSTSPPEYDSLSRFVTLPDVGEFLLFSKIVADDMVLSMVFNANTPVRTIRRQARRLSESLALVPEQVASPEPPASVTRPARPTDLRAPEGLRAPAAPREQPAPVPRAVQPDTVYAGYTLLWLPWDPRLELSGSYAEALSGWIESIAQQSAWDIDALAIETDYVQMALKVPQKSLPDVVIHTLFDETARRTEEHFPELVDAAGRLWANGYYVVTPPRELSEREIGRFITYQRQAQAG